MQIDYAICLNMNDACLDIGVHSILIHDIVAHGIIAPLGNTPADWQFDLEMICTAKRAIRLQHDLQLDWSAVALLLSLLEERDQLRADNEQLRQQLLRFLHG